jgi:thymidylate synthase ThyX
MTSATIIGDSINPNGDRISTLILRYPRIIHSELMTHRVFSRNAASSRAIPLNKMIEMVSKDPFIPQYWLKNKSGMSGGEEASQDEIKALCEIWLGAMDDMIKRVGQIDKFNIHKSIPNRLLEPFMFIEVLCTATEWQNFFDLRVHPDAEPHFNELATKIYDARRASQPKQLQWGEWHIPSKETEEECKLDLSTRLKIATAKAARISYANHDKEYSVENQVDRTNKLITSGHFSPLEHCAQANEYVFCSSETLRKSLNNWLHEEYMDEYNEVWGIAEDNCERFHISNFNGFLQFRHQLNNFK